MRTFVLTSPVNGSATMRSVSTRSMVFEEAVDLPRVGILYAGVEGFLNVPVLGRLLVPPVVAAHGA